LPRPRATNNFDTWIIRERMHSGVKKDPAVIDEQYAKGGRRRVHACSLLEENRAKH